MSGPTDGRTRRPTASTTVSREDNGSPTSVDEFLSEWRAIEPEPAEPAPFDRTPDPEPADPAPVDRAPADAETTLTGRRANDAAQAAPEPIEVVAARTAELPAVRPPVRERPAQRTDRNPERPRTEPAVSERKRRRRRVVLVPLAIVAGLALLGLGAVGYAAFGPTDDETASSDPATESAPTIDDPTADILRLLQGIGYDGIDVELRDGMIHVTGTVADQADVAAVVTATASLAEGIPIDADGLEVAPAEPAGPEADEATTAADPAPAADPLRQLQVTLDRTTAATPIIFDRGTSTIAPWHEAALDRVAELLLANPGIAVTVVGYTDDTGGTDQNQALSQERAEAVRAYLVERGIGEGLIQTVARGESDATGLRDLGYLERRVEFEIPAAAQTTMAVTPLDIGVIVPSPRDDLAFSQSLVDALEVLDGERGGLTLDISDNMFDVELAGEQAEQYATGGSDVVILHGAQYRPLVEPLAQGSPDVVFIAGPDPVDTDLPNVFVYTIAAEQGAFVMGDLAASLSGGTVGIVGPLPVPEPQLFVEGFRLGAEQGGAQVVAEYAGSFNDVEVATAIAESHVAAGADVLTGTSQLTVGPIAVAERDGLPWFANQANQTELAPANVVASQVYHFEVAIREILAEIDADSTTGGTFPLTLGNGGMLLEFNPGYPLDENLRRRADRLVFEVTAGAVDVSVDLGE